MVRIRPPKLDSLLKALSESEPNDLRVGRAPAQRILGACVLESHLLAAMLRHRMIPVRVRAGYFRGIMTDRPFILKLWEGALAARGMREDLRKDDPARWKAELDEFTSRQIAVDHRIEQWVCEYWDASGGEWRLLDSNTDFLKPHSHLEVPFHLPRA
jgi:hypothetical protein